MKEWEKMKEIAEPPEQQSFQDKNWYTEGGWGQQSFQVQDQNQKGKRNRYWNTTSGGPGPSKKSRDNSDGKSGSR